MLRRARLRSAAAVPALALAVTLTACTGGSDGGAAGPSPSPSSSTTGTSSPSAAPEPVAVPPAPRTGACYRLTVAAATRPTNGADPVPCTTRHTARTAYVGRLDTVVDGHALAVDSTRVQRQLATTCPRRLATFLGGTLEERRLSRFQTVWFSPTLAQSDAGADWFRCDVIAFGDADRLLPLPPGQRLQGVLDRPGTLDRYGLCGTTAPGGSGFERVACSLPHRWRATSTISLDGGDRYPGAARLRSAGDDTCSTRVREAAGFALQFRYGWEYPTKDQWAAGQRWGYCWAPTDQS